MTKMKVDTAMFRAIRRSFTEGIRGMVKNGLMTVTSVFVVTSCIFVFGVFLMAIFNINYMTNSMASDYRVDVYVARPADGQTETYNETKKKVRDEIVKIKNVDASNINLVDGVQKFDDYKKGLDKEELSTLDGLPDTLIPDAFTVKLKDLSKADETIEALSQIENVENVENSRELVDMIDSVKNIVRRISIWIIVAFALVSLFIISNTIKLTVHNRRKEINIMKYVGATDSYIRGPFIMEGILVGLISAGVAFFISRWSYEGLMSAINSRVSQLLTNIGMLSFSQIWSDLIIAYLALGCVIGALGSFISVRRYLHV